MSPWVLTTWGMPAGKGWGCLLRVLWCADECTHFPFLWATSPCSPGAPKTWNSWVSCCFCTSFSHWALYWDVVPLDLCIPIHTTLCIEAYKWKTAFDKVLSLTMSLPFSFGLWKEIPPGLGLAHLHPGRCCSPVCLLKILASVSLRSQTIKLLRSLPVTAVPFYAKFSKGSLLFFYSVVYPKAWLISESSFQQATDGSCKPAKASYLFSEAQCNSFC